jgi:mannose-6-phosphate isomerase-like protein (cupin superfamily)
VSSFTQRQLPAAADVLAPDGSEVRILAATPRGSMAHFKLLPGQVAKAIRHRSVDEVWYVIAGEGEIWRMTVAEQSTTALVVGLSLTLPAATSFQFRNTGSMPLEIIGVTMPPWPGEAEAEFVDGPW